MLHHHEASSPVIVETAGDSNDVITIVCALRPRDVTVSILEVVIVYVVIGFGLFACRTVPTVGLSSMPEIIRCRDSSASNALTSTVVGLLARA